MAAVAYVGAVGGALIGLHIPKAAFNPIILVCSSSSAPTRSSSPTWASETALRFDGHRHTVVAMLTGFVIGVYDGALGPGTGSFLVFALVGLIGYAFLEASAKAKIANFATNLGALTVFVPGRPRHGQGRARHGRRPTSSAATSAPGPRSGSAAGSCAWSSSSSSSAFIVRISLQLLGVWP